MLTQWTTEQGQIVDYTFIFPHKFLVNKLL